MRFFHNLGKERAGDPAQEQNKRRDKPISGHGAREGGAKQEMGRRGKKTKKQSRNLTCMRFRWVISVLHHQVSNMCALFAVLWSLSLELEL